MRLKKFIGSWKKSLLSVSNKIGRSFNEEVLPILMSGSPQQNDFRTFCMSDETEKVYQKLEEIITIG